MRNPKAALITVSNGSQWDDNQIDIGALHNRNARFVEITNTSGSHGIDVRLNKDDDCVFIVYSNSTQVFNNGDIECWCVELAQAVSGGGDVDVQVIYSV